MTAPPPWWRVAPAFDRNPTPNARQIADRDQAGALYARLFAAFEVDTTDPANLYTAMVALEVARYAITNAHGNGAMTEAEADTARRILSGLVTVVADLVPAEARP